MTKTRTVALLLTGSLLLAPSIPAAAVDDAIVNNSGRWWHDIDGGEMILFPNTLLKVGDTFYMYGEWCFEDENSGRNALRCYSSKDLVHWKFEGDVLTQAESHLINRGTVLYNPLTKQYVYCYKFRRPMRFPGWKFGDGILAWAASSSPAGRFKAVHKDERVGIVAGQVTLFRDDDGKVYAIADGTFDAQEGKRINVYELSSDYCSIVRRICDLGTGQEAASILKIRGKYWAFASGLNDWYYSPTSYRSAENIAGPWTPWQMVPTDPASPDTFKTQEGGLIFEVRGTAGAFHVWTGVRYWDTIPIGPVRARESSPPGIRPASLWLPLQWRDGKPLLKYYPAWQVNAAAGTWTASLAGTGAETGRTTNPFPAVEATSTAPSMPRIDGTWWNIAGNPDLGEWTSPEQQPVDFSIWRAADGTWQLMSCIRNTKLGGRTRLFHRWEGRQLTGTDWRPMGVAMLPEAGFGEESVQSPFVFREGGLYHLFYGDWNSICRATGKNGKTFTRDIGPNGKTGLFGEGTGNFARDPMVLKIGDTFHCYYCANPEGKGQGRGIVYCRTSKDMKPWSESKQVAFGGMAGTNWTSAECPFVWYHPVSGYYYLFRTQVYLNSPQTTIYASKDPMDFGINDDRYRLGALPVAAPEIVEHQGRMYLASLLPSLKGVRLARLKW